MRVGIDIVKIERIAKIYEKYGDKFKTKFLSKKEIKEIKSVDSLAGYFAVKEATSKALGVGIGASFGFLDVKIVKNTLNAPKLKFKKAIKKKFKIKKSTISISHDGGFVVAVVVIE
ncbi:holo-ACP synthase [uncultured Campylobacter sp.]|uniref:holo-ACP synthase n=1 Tax=uncultured Campylobacter sp. TaxID=218934 RepID=UPI00261059EA|nr:holo-ACP synthase [uncultured Campylobacter sp.]